MNKIILGLAISFFLFIPLLFGVVLHSQIGIIQQCQDKGGVWLSTENVCAKSDGFIIIK